MIKKIIAFVKKTLCVAIDLIVAVISFIFRGIKGFLTKIFAIFKL